MGSCRRGPGPPPRPSSAAAAEPRSTRRPRRVPAAAPRSRRPPAPAGPPPGYQQQQPLPYPPLQYGQPQYGQPPHYGPGAAGWAPDASRIEQRTKNFILWGWLTATIGTFIIPLLCIGGVVLGALVISRGEGQKTGHGVAIIIVSLVVGMFAFFFWLGVWDAGTTGY